MEIKVTSCKTCPFLDTMHDADIADFNAWCNVGGISLTFDVIDWVKNKTFPPPECPLLKGELTVKLELTQNPSNEG